MLLLASFPPPSSNDYSSRTISFLCGLSPHLSPHFLFPFLLSLASVLALLSHPSLDRLFRPCSPFVIVIRSCYCMFLVPSSSSPYPAPAFLLCFILCTYFTPPLPSLCNSSSTSSQFTLFLPPSPELNLSPPLLLPTSSPFSSFLKNKHEPQQHRSYIMHELASSSSSSFSPNQTQSGNCRTRNTVSFRGCTLVWLHIT